MSSSESFYWHDYETSGADVACDRPLQFAGVRTDRDFKVVGEPLVLYNRLTPDILPHPAAMRITGISTRDVQAKGLAECDFIGRIHEQLALPGTCGVGYNSIRFDDEITRYTLYRNFFDPYARERDAGRSRWDLIDVARAVFALRPEGLVWPTRDDGLPSFRLEHLSAANGIEHGAAHDALSDVYATIGLARALKTAQPALFEALYAQRLKTAAQSLLDPSQMRPVIHVSGMFGAARSFLAMVIPLAMHPENRNEVICADLAAEPDFLDWPIETLRERLFTRQDELPEGVSRPGIKTIRVNRSPVVLPGEWLAGEPAERLGLDGDTHRRHLAVWRDAHAADPVAFRARIQSIFAQPRFEPRTDPDSQLYDGFFDRSDSGQFPDIRAASADQLQQQTFSFRDPRLTELLFRYRARNFPESLTPEEQGRWREHCALKLRDGPDFNLAAFEHELREQEAMTDLSAQQRQALVDLREYVSALEQSFQSIH